MLQGNRRVTLLLLLSLVSRGRGFSLGILSMSQVAVVTGGNRGIGYEICRQLLDNDMKVVLTARSISKGQEAARSLGNDCLFLQCDVTDKLSRERLKSDMKQEFGGIDALILNAAIGYKGKDDFTPLTAMKVIETNCYGARDVARELLPLMQPNGRIVFVSSRSGGMWRLSEEKRDLFWKAGTSDELLETAMKKFIADVRKDAWTDGWPSPGLGVPYVPGLGLPESADGKLWIRATELGVYFTAGAHHTAYCVSKAGMNAVARQLAGQVQNGIKVNACCPGWVRTEMAGSLAPSSIAEGASTPVFLACLGVDSTFSGKFFAASKEIQW